MKFPPARVLALLLLLAQGAGGQSATVTGYTTDASSGEGLPGANVFLTETRIGAATNGDGYFVLTGVPPGSYEIQVTYLGYAAYADTIMLAPGQQLRINVELERQAMDFEEIEVSGQRLDRQVNSQLSRVTLSTRQLAGLPQVAEADLLRALQALPGVLTTSELSTGLVIRGGNTDQNLILLDGITVYNPSHLGGLFSNFILEAVQQAELIKGGFNAEYGGRLSAVLNVTSREGNSKRLAGKASVSLLSAQTTLEGPVGRGAWLASVRRPYFDVLFKGTDFYFPYYFYDFQGHIFQDITDRDRLSVSWYLGRDDLAFDSFGLNADWGNKTYSLAYRKLFSPQLVSKWMLAASRFDTQFALGEASGARTESLVDDLTFRSDWTWFGPRKGQIKAGLEVKRLTFTYSSIVQDSSFFDLHQEPTEAALYQKAKIWLGEKLMLEPGLRVTYYNLHPQRWFFDPRFSMKYLLTPDRYLNFAVGVYHQFMETLQDDYNPTVLDSWLAVDGSVDAANSVQAVVGYEAYFGGRYRFQLEVYAKTLDNLLTFSEGRSTPDEAIGTVSLADFLDVSSGRAYGLEIFLQREVGRLTGWFSYAWSVAEKDFAGITYFTNWDRRHVVNLIGAYRPNDRWEANLKWTYQTGQPYTPILGYYLESLPGQSDYGFVPIPGGRNTLRYPPYHRLDLGLVRHFKTRKGTQIDLFLQVVNAYWRKNVFAYYYVTGSTINGLDDDDDGQIDEADEEVPRRETLSIFPLLPSIGFSIAF